MRDHLLRSHLLVKYTKCVCVFHDEGWLQLN